MSTPTVRLWYALLVSFLACITVMLGSVMYANHVAQESERKWCRVVTTMDDAWKDRPPPSSSGQQLAEEIRRLRAEFRCDESKG